MYKWSEIIPVAKGIEHWYSAVKYLTSDLLFSTYGGPIDVWG